MMKINKSQILLSVFICIVISQPTYYQKALLQDQIYQNACENLQLGAIIFQGTSLFQQDAQSSALCTPHMVISGWFLLRPYSTINQVYTIFTVKETTNSISITLQYKYNVQKFVLEQQNQLFPSPLTGSLEKIWIYIYADFVFQNSQLKTQLIIQIISKLIDGIALTSSISLNPTYPSFDKMNTQVEIGSPLNSTPSCAMIKKIEFYWLNDISQFSFKPDEDDQFNLSSGNTYLYHYFDFFYTDQNRGKLMNGAGLNQNPILLSHLRSNSEEIKAGEVVSTDYINIDEEFGIILNFQAKLSNPTNNTFTTLLTITNKDYPIELSFVNNNSFKLINETIPQAFSSDWIHFTFLIKNQFAPRLAVLIVYPSSPPETFIQSIPLSTKLILERIQFGKVGNQQSIFVSNIRIYKGTYLQAQNYCYAGAQQQTSQCLTCTPTYLLKFSPSMTCLQDNGLTQEIYGVYDQRSERMVCNQNMKNNQSNLSICVCIKGFYKDTDNNCVRCPTYCKQCSNSTACILGDPQRQSNGDCSNITFDDGYSCLDLSSLFKINSKVNIVEYKYFSNYSNSNISAYSSSNCASDTSWYNKYYVISSSQLNSASSDKFFITFSFSLVEDTSIDAQVFLYNGGGSFILKVVVKYNSPYYQVLIYDDTVIQNIFNINQNEEVWVGIYLTPSNVSTLINQHGTLQVNQYAKTVLPVDHIQIGSSPISGSSTCISLSKTKPFQLIYDIPQPSDIKMLNQLYRSDKKILAQFTVDITYQYYTSKSLNTLVDEQSNILFLEFPESLSSFSIISGFTFTNGLYAQIAQFTNDSNCALSFFFIIQVSEIHMQTPLISYQLLNGFEVKISLFPYINSETIAFRICFGTECKDGNYSYFFLNDVNYIVISSKQVTPFSSDLYFQEFEIVCNQKREKLQFIGNQQAFGNKIDDFKIGYSLDTLNSYNYTLNNINIIEGDGFFYYNYDFEVCFTYINISNMKCLYLKSSYVYCNNIIFNESRCQMIVDNSLYYYYYNKFNQTQTESNILKSDCLSVALDEIRNSLICTDRSSPAFQCFYGQYNDAISQQCLPCAFMCSTCSGSSTNCTSCKVPEGKILPSCSCISQDEFIDENLTCQKCDNKCNQCYEQDSKCTVCAPNRINPPFCECDPNNYTQQGNECVLISCDSKCEYCVDSSSNCTKCSVYRENPPYCSCMSGFEESQDGSCSGCKQNQYFDESSKKCLSCSSGCNKCAGQSCLECQSPLELQNNSCVCGNESQSQVIKTNFQNEVSLDCLNNMSITIQTQQYKSYYDLIIIFSNELTPIDFQANSLFNLLNVHFTVIPSSSYVLSNPRMSNNKLIIRLDLTINISKIYGYLLFVDNQKFISVSKTEILGYNYTKQPTQFEIGPFFSQKDGVSQSLDDATQGILESQAMNSSMMNFLNKIQFLFYILNTLQPSSYFLLLKAIYPPHLYKFYQIIGKLIFPFVPDYSSSVIKEEFNLFDYYFQKNEISLVVMSPYEKLGYSTSMLVNVTMILLKYFIFLGIYGLIKIVPLILRIHSDNLKIEKILFLLKGRLDVENEVNLLSIALAILIQLFNTAQDQWISRVGLYISIIILFYYGLYFYQNYLIIKTNKFIEMNDYYFTSRVDLEQYAQSIQLYKYYFLIQYTKKYLALLFLFIFYTYPIIGCSLNTALFAISCFLTILLKPYKHQISRILKIVGEFLFAIIWLLHAILISQEKQVYQNYIINQDILTNYNNLGSVIMILLFTYNLIYLVEFIFGIIDKIYQIYQQKLKKKGNEITIKFSSMQLKDLQLSYELSSSEQKPTKIKQLLKTNK